ncbi:hypothetical protein TSAR_004428 [Trichomalopsis sarcophagae]|uniref:Uncharacterized protein n=1 Tax=Trichomalopsis sarcophagae TaxID=543379 RepID=A0A232FAR3_9HYME|nr:hypothetical protein TSAR_004428 [Trichomalopsis sarcophagae]
MRSHFSKQDRPSSNPFMTGYSYPFPGSNNSSRRDIGKVARELNIKYDEHKKSCIEEFIND